MGLIINLNNRIGYDIILVCYFIVFSVLMIDSVAILVRLVFIICGMSRLLLSDI